MNEKLQKVKKHLSENRWIYVAGLGIAAAGAGGYLLGSGTVVVPNQQAIGYKSTINQTQITVVARRGHPGNMVRVNETGDEFMSVRQAAEVLGLHRRDIFNHLHGLKPDVKGFTFTDLGEAK